MATKTASSKQQITPKRKMTFTEIMDSEYRTLIDQIEWGCSDTEIMDRMIDNLYQETGYYWVREIADPNATPQAGMYLSYTNWKGEYEQRKIKSITKRLITFEDDNPSTVQLPWFNTHRKDFTLYY